MKKLLPKILAAFMILVSLSQAVYAAPAVSEREISDFVNRMAKADITDIVFDQAFTDNGEADIYFGLPDYYRFTDPYSLLNADYTIVCKNGVRSMDFSGKTSPIHIDLPNVGPWGRWHIGLRITLTFAAYPDRPYTIEQPMFSIYPYKYVFSESVQNQKTVPNPPQNVTAAATGPSQAVVGFSPPVHDGGSGVITYTATSNPDKITANGTTSPIKINGLRAGIAYTFTVRALNAAGYSHESNTSAPVTPKAFGAAAPNAETDTSAPLSVKLTIGETGYTINGAPFQLDAAPFIDPATGRAMAPLLFVARALGADLDWDNDTGTDTITLNGHTLRIRADEPLPGGMGTAVMAHDRLFVPLRYISEYLGAAVEWDEVTRSVTITK